jgi:hypothetical protein
LNFLELRKPRILPGLPSMSDVQKSPETALDRDRQRANAEIEQFKRLQFAWRGAGEPARAEFLAWSGLWVAVMHQAPDDRPAENASQEGR